MSLAIWLKTSGSCDSYLKCFQYNPNEGELEEYIRDMCSFETFGEFKVTTDPVNTDYENKVTKHISDLLDSIQ